MTRLRPPGFRVGLALLAVAAIACTLLVRAPAAWLGDSLEARTRLRLVDAQGTVWRGSALLGVSDGRRTALIPGRVSWTIDLRALGSGKISLHAAHEWLGGSLDLTLAGDAIEVRAGSAQLPAAALGALGMPFTTLRPGGLLEARWSDLALLSGARAAELSGELQVDWRDAQSALSSVAPLGHYRLSIRGTQGVAQIRLETLSGPLRLQGGGTLRGGRIRFDGVASAVPEMRAALSGLLSLLGVRSGDNALLSLET